MPHYYCVSETSSTFTHSRQVLAQEPIARHRAPHRRLSFILHDEHKYNFTGKTTITTLN